MTKPEMLDKINELETGILAYYENLIEQDRLIVLPCKVGDTAYRVNGTTETIEEVEITAIEVREKMWIEIRDGVCGRTKYPMNFGRVFFTREEAEAALERSKPHGD